MATARQKRVAKLIVENATLDKPLNSGQMLENVGYSKHLIKQPSRIIESQGVQEELEVLGFNEYTAKEVVSSILQDGEIDPTSRLRAADMVFKVRGSYAPMQTETKNLNMNVEVSPDALQAIKAAEEQLKKLKL